jgi:hypothetical protein
MSNIQLDENATIKDLYNALYSYPTTAIEGVFFLLDEMEVVKEVLEPLVKKQKYILDAKNRIQLDTEFVMDWMTCKTDFIVFGNSDNSPTTWKPTRAACRHKIKDVIFELHYTLGESLSMYKIPLYESQSKIPVDLHEYKCFSVPEEAWSLFVSFYHHKENLFKESELENV